MHWTDGQIPPSVNLRHSWKARVMVMPTLQDQREDELRAKAWAPAPGHSSPLCTWDGPLLRPQQVLKAAQTVAVHETMPPASRCTRRCECSCAGLRVQARYLREPAGGLPVTSESLNWDA